VIGGLLSSMVLSLVFTPAIHYYLLECRSRARGSFYYLRDTISTR
jgi:Cu/Ag efflux pump CusA